MYAGTMSELLHNIACDFSLDCIPIEKLRRRIGVIALLYTILGSQCMSIQSSPGQGILTHALRPCAAGQVGCICAFQRGWAEAGHPATLACRPTSAWHQELSQLREWDERSRT